MSLGLWEESRPESEFIGVSCCELIKGYAKTKRHVLNDSQGLGVLVALLVICERCSSSYPLDKTWC